MLDFNWYKFSELSPDALYDVLTLRAKVFVVDQQCAYLDPDGIDKQALHLLGTVNGALVAYLRLYSATNNPHALMFGRVVTDPSARKKGYGKVLLQNLISYCDQYLPDKKLECSAQLYLQKFYESFGFKAVGAPYQEDGIPHIHMHQS